MRRSPLARLRGRRLLLVLGDGPIELVAREGEGIVVAHNARKALEVSEGRLAPGTESLWASTDGKTFINIVETDTPDMTASSTYAPFFEKTKVIQVVPVDDSWMQAIQNAQSNRG